MIHMRIKRFDPFCRFTSQWNTHNTNKLKFEMEAFEQSERNCFEIIDDCSLFRKGETFVFYT